MRKIIAVPDTHFPFHCKSSLKAILKAIKEEQPNVVVQLGDLYDFFSFSRFPKQPDVIKPHEEIEHAYSDALEFWTNVKREVPRATLYQLLGNHCVRPHKLALERCPDLYPLIIRSWKDLFQFKGVHTILNPRDDLELDGIVFEHGFYTQPGKHLRNNMKSTVIGHTHRPWIHYEKIRKALLFELNCGHAADVTHSALSYTPKKFNPWVKGYGLIENGIPIFVFIDE